MQGKEVYECVVISDGSGFFKKGIFLKTQIPKPEKFLTYKESNHENVEMLQTYSAKNWN